VGKFTDLGFPVVLPFGGSGQTKTPELYSFYVGEILLFDLIDQRYKCVRPIS
jgi:hypothetical protein